MIEPTANLENLLLMLKNSAEEWGSVSRAVHWLLVLLVAIQIPLGFWMADIIETYTQTQGDDLWVMRSTNMHHTIGFLILGFTFLRVNWRMNNPTPNLPAGYSAYKRYLARTTQVCSYVLMIFYPVTGWAVSSASAQNLPIFFFGFEIPRMIAPQADGSTFAYDLFLESHRACWKIGAALLLLHVAGAVWGQFIKKNQLLARMWRGHF